jgi:uncharacterized membrane protein
MNDEAVEVIVAGFRNEADAKEAMSDLKVAKKQGFAEYGDVALLTRDEEQKLHIAESADKGFGQGAMIGGVAGAAVGLLAGPIGWAALGGAAIGGLAAKLRDGGFPDQELREMGESIKPGSAAVVAVVERTWMGSVEQLLQQHGAEVKTKEVAPDLAETLDRDAAEAQQSGPP